MTTIDKGDLYATAADLIRTRGLAKGSFADRKALGPRAASEKDCALCAFGALAVAGIRLAPEATCFGSWFPDVLDKPGDEVEALTPPDARGDHNLVAYNDDDTTTAEDVAALFDRAAEIHRGETVEV